MEEWQKKIDKNAESWYLHVCNDCQQKLFWVYENDAIFYYDVNGNAMTQEQADDINRPAIDPHEIGPDVDVPPIICIICNDKRKKAGNETWEYDK